MVTTQSNIDPAAQLEKALSIIETQQLTIRNLQLQILQLNKIVFGSRHERFVGDKDENAPTLFDVPELAEVITTASTTVTYEKTNKQLRPNHKGRNSFPESLRREEQILYPEGVDIAAAKKIGEDVTETLAYIPCGLYVKNWFVLNCWMLLPTPFYRLPHQSALLKKGVWTQAWYHRLL